MGIDPERLAQALDGKIALRDLVHEEAVAFDAAIQERIDSALAGADFSAVAPPERMALRADLQERLADIASRSNVTHLFYAGLSLS